MRKEERVTRVGGAANEHASDLIAAVRPRREHFYRVQLALCVLPFRSFRQMEGISCWLVVILEDGVSGFGRQEGQFRRYSSWAWGTAEKAAKNVLAFAVVFDVVLLADVFSSAAAK